MNNFHASFFVVFATLFFVLAVLGDDGGIDLPKAEQVTCGSAIKLQHVVSKAHLHSHEVNYGTGSGQQSVTGNTNEDDANSLWLVFGPKDKECPQGKPFKNGDLVRLMHMKTRKWLHSHRHQSPLSGGWEVSCFGAPDSSDEGDLWKIEMESNPKSGYWDRDARLRLFHTGMQGYLSSSEQVKFGAPIVGQQEVAIGRDRSANTVWRATQGVYFSTVKK
eukprot:jgi/Mesvir1/3485/Mv11976-RA.1